MLCYSAKDKAVRALKENFIEGIDYQCLAQNGETATGGYRKIIYSLSVPCLEFFIARKVRPVFDVYREVFHKSVNAIPKVIRSNAADKRKIVRLEAEIERLEEQLKWIRWSERREVELKCSCFHYLVETGQYQDWEKFRRSGKL